MLPGALGTSARMSTQSDEPDTEPTTEGDGPGSGPEKPEADLDVVPDTD